MGLSFEQDVRISCSLVFCLSLAFF